MFNQNNTLAVGWIQCIPQSNKYIALNRSCDHEMQILGDGQTTPVISSYPIPNDEYSKGQF